MVNIFFLSEDPVESANMQCDQHVVKMPLESAQMLCSAYSKTQAPYRRTHYNHPSNIWIRESNQNYQWLIMHGLALCEEYHHRFGKTHASEEVILWCWGHSYLLSFQKTSLSPLPKVMPDLFKVESAIESYRKFYIGEKSKFARWNNGRVAPPWYSQANL